MKNNTRIHMDFVVCCKDHSASLYWTVTSCTRGKVLVLNEKCKFSSQSEGDYTSSDLTAMFSSTFKYLF